MTTPRPPSGKEPGPTAGPVCPAGLRCGPVSHAITRVARLHRMLEGSLLRRAGLHPGQEALMMHLWETGAQRQSELTALLGSDSATMTRAVQRLERAGFVRRVPCPTDRRGVIIEPTAASQALRQEIEEIWWQLEEATVSGLTEEERATALRVLDRLEANLANRA
ncbi:MarR family winged helix-turn-helix transcriptional regulator [Actinorugispora endophytica]|uniref:DNA-binding MarR family transcriptional regulator n=1 Tax=Actinorugispora endophytica TaxID=1605990 RepID=A0A4R6V0C5_9ACTN|nr:MarR family winged helix-turn-helix transcriptional regulator [Actinorugispora endophytica]TDQ53135.1 DNA-binding MarR family transcriptional regulator [Actinorugispora endophytica]